MVPSHPLQALWRAPPWGGLWRGRGRPGMGIPDIRGEEAPLPGISCLPRLDGCASAALDLLHPHWLPGVIAGSSLTLKGGKRTSHV